MKKVFFYLFFTFATVLSAFSQDEYVLECSYTSNQSYKTLIVLGEDKFEAVETNGQSFCHYDVAPISDYEDYLVCILHNPSLSNWIPDIVVISLSEDEKSYVICPRLKDNIINVIDVELIEEPTKIAAKKKAYGILYGVADKPRSQRSLKSFSRHQ